ncbi:MAG: hypothetical protein V3S69_08020 [Dehalococcoidales bacterium]
MIVRIEGRINVDGQWWDIETEHNVADDRSSDDKVRVIKGVIKGLASTGEIISRVGAIDAPVGPKNVPLPHPPANGTQSALFTWPTPRCEVHSEAMAVSKVQNNPAWRSFYCPRKMGAGYCRHRAKVDVGHGMPTFFEVKS